MRWDRFGRVAEDASTLADGTFATVYSEYNAMGWKLRQSTPSTGAALGWTKFENHDETGRPGRIVAPDGSKTELRYFGARSVQRDVWIATSATSASAVTETKHTTSEQYDHQGRLWKVTEPPGGLDATYTYDPGGRLRQAKLVAQGGGTQQIRSFLYDGRGVLYQESHPESGTVFYSQHDARGRAWRKDHGGTKLSFSYDKGERLVRVHDVAGPAPVLLKSFTYGTANGTSKGKLVQSVRANRITIPWNGHAATVSVTEDYFYTGLGGRRSTRLTSLTSGQSFRTDWTYDPSGNVASINYPRCTQPSCAASPPEW